MKGDSADMVIRQLERLRMLESRASTGPWSVSPPAYRRNPGPYRTAITCPIGTVANAFTSSRGSTYSVDGKWEWNPPPPCEDALLIAMMRNRIKDMADLIEALLVERELFADARELAPDTLHRQLAGYRVREVMEKFGRGE